MGRKQINHSSNKDSIAHRKQQKIQKSHGMFKKLDKSLQPPKLDHFKKKVIQTLKNKQTERTQTINNLSTQRRLHLHHFLEEQQKQFEMPVEEEEQEKELVHAHHDSNKYHKEMKKLIEACDIIVEVLDVRDPLACRCKNIERKILGMPDKKIILALNKIDLVPMENAYAWQNYLRREYPVVLFKANLQNQSSHLSSSTVFKKSIANHTQAAEDMIQSSKAIGPDHLIQLLKQLSRVDGSTRAVTVGLIGYPNVGKSSVINSLKRSKTCQVSAIPGSTKNLKQVKLDSQVKLIDCPGVIFEKQLTKNQLILQNTLKGDTDLEEVVQAILERISMKQMTEFYKIDPFTSTTDFLAKVCRAHGKLGKGGVPEMKQGAKIVVQDWNKGKLKYFTVPPTVESGMMEE